MPGIFSPTKVLHFFNAPTDFSEANVHEVRIVMELFSSHPFSYGVLASCFRKFLKISI